MKRKSRIIIIIMVLTFFMLPFLWAGQEAEVNKTAENISNERFGVLKNGFSVFVKKRDNLPLVNIVFAVNVGSKDESAETSGLVHLLEHMLLLGETKSSSVEKTAREMRRHGAHFNAHTSHDIMTFEVSLPAEYWEFGLKILKEKLFHLKLSQSHLDKEKKIIFKELDQHRDNPITMGSHLALQHLFKGHPYEQPIIGNREVIEKAAIEQLEAFYRQYFILSNSSIAVVGDVDTALVGEKIKAMFGESPEPGQVPPVPSFPPVPALKKKIKIEKKLDIQQCHLVIAFQAPSSNHGDQLPMNFLDRIFGKGLNPLLSRILVKRGKRLTTSVSTRYYPMKYGGAFLIYLTLEKKHLNSVRMTLLKFLKMAWKYNYSKEDFPLGQRRYITDYIETTRNNIKFSHQEFQEMGLNAAVTYARYMLFAKGRKEKQAPYMEQISGVNSGRVRDIASKYFAGKNYVTITLIPGKKEK